MAAVVLAMTSGGAAQAADDTGAASGASSSHPSTASSSTSSSMNSGASTGSVPGSGTSALSSETPAAGSVGAPSSGLPSSGLSTGPASSGLSSTTESGLTGSGASAGLSPMGGGSMGTGSTGGVQSMSGEIASIDPATGTVQIREGASSSPMNISVLPDRTSISRSDATAAISGPGTLSRGTALGLQDLAPGDRVQITYMMINGQPVARAIVIGEQTAG